MFHKAEMICELALEWALKVNEDELRATVLHTLASIKSAGGEIGESTRILKLCLADLHAIGNIVGQAFILLNIGYNHRRLEQYHEAIESLNEARNIALTVNEFELAALCYLNLSRCYLARNEPELVRGAIAGARELLPELESATTEVELNLLECRAFTAVGKMDDAVELLKNTYQLSLRHNLDTMQADVQFEQGLVYNDIGEVQTAACKLVAAAQRYRQLGLDEKYRAATMILGQLKKVVDV